MGSAEYPPLQRRQLPEPPPWHRALGVGVVVMGLSIGTGELIMWPHLVAKHGLGLLWLALLGVAAQYLLNHEVARHALATGESFFTSSARVLRWLPPLWLLAALLLYVWPGWASALGTALRELFGFGTHLGWAWGALGLVVALTFVGRVAYRLLETTLKVVVPAFFLLLVAISFMNLDATHLAEGWRGLLAFGHVPAGVDVNVLLSAVVFAGAGGLLNLCVGLWYRDKGLGMASYVSHIVNPITGRRAAAEATGYTFSPTPAQMVRWRGWMRYVRVDQGIIFALLGFVTLALLCLNAFAVLRPAGLVPEGMQVAVVQALIFGQHWGSFGYHLFLAMAALMLFAVMWTVVDALARTVSDIVYTNAQVGPLQRLFAPLRRVSLSWLYYGTVAAVAAVGAGLLPLRQPLALLVTSAVLGGVTMALYTPLLIYLNNRRLPGPLRPSLVTNLAMGCVAAFFAFFAYRVVAQYLG